MHEQIAQILPFRVLEATEGKPLRIAGVAMTAGMSRNHNVYTPEELQAFAPKLIGSPLYLEHVTVNNAIGKVTNCTFDAQTKSLLYEAEIYDPTIAEKIRQGLIQHVSVGADYDTLDSANVPHGLHNAEMSLVAVPGIPETNIQVLESLLRKGPVKVQEQDGRPACAVCGQPADFLVSICQTCLDKAGKTTEQLEPEIPGEYFLGFVQDPNLFLPEHFRTVWLDQANGVLAVMAKTRSDLAAERCQEILFLKSKWQPNTVADWLRMHPDYTAVAAAAELGVQSNGVEELDEKDLEKLAEKLAPKLKAKEALMLKCPKCGMEFDATQWEANGWKCPNKDCGVEVTPPASPTLTLKGDPSATEKLVAAESQLGEAKTKLATAEGKLTEANSTVEKLKQLVPGVDLLKNPPKLMPVSEALERLGRLELPKMQERLSLGNQLQAQKVRKEIFEVKQKYGDIDG